MSRWAPVSSTAPIRPTNTDTARAYSFCKLLGEHYGEKLLICPPVTYGISTHHMAFEGTITLRPETYIYRVSRIQIALLDIGEPPCN